MDRRAGGVTITADAMTKAVAAWMRSHAASLKKAAVAAPSEGSAGAVGGVAAATATANTAEQRLRTSAQAAVELNRLLLRRVHHDPRLRRAVLGEHGDGGSDSKRRTSTLAAELAAIGGPLSEAEQARLAAAAGVPVAFARMLALCDEIVAPEATAARRETSMCESEPKRTRGEAHHPPADERGAHSTASKPGASPAASTVPHAASATGTEDEEESGSSGSEVPARQREHTFAFDAATAVPVLVPPGGRLPDARGVPVPTASREHVEALATVLRSIRHDDFAFSCVLLRGPAGSGKTHAAVGVGPLCLGGTCVYISLADHADVQEMDDAAFGNLVCDLIASAVPESHREPPPPTASGHDTPPVRPLLVVLDDFGGSAEMICAVRDAFSRRAYTPSPEPPHSQRATHVYAVACARGLMNPFQFDFRIPSCCEAALIDETAHVWATLRDSVPAAIRAVLPALPVTAEDPHKLAPVAATLAGSPRLAALFVAACTAADAFAADEDAAAAVRRHMSAAVAGEARLLRIPSGKVQNLGAPPPPALLLQAVCAMTRETLPDDARAALCNTYGLVTDHGTWHQYHRRRSDPSRLDPPRDTVIARLILPESAAMKSVAWHGFDGSWDKVELAPKPPAVRYLPSETTLAMARSTLACGSAAAQALGESAAAEAARFVMLAIELAASESLWFAGKHIYEAVKAMPEEQRPPSGWRAPLAIVGALPGQFDAGPLPFVVATCRDAVANALVSAPLLHAGSPHVPDTLNEARSASAAPHGDTQTCRPTTAHAPTHGRLTALEALRAGCYAVVLANTDAERFGGTADVVALAGEDCVFRGRRLLVCRVLFDDENKPPLSALDAFHALHSMGNREPLSVVAAGLRAVDATTRGAMRRFVHRVNEVRFGIATGEEPDEELFACFVVAAPYWWRDSLDAALNAALGESLLAALTAPNAALRELVEAAKAGAAQSVSWVHTVFVLMVRGPRPEALESTRLVPPDVQLLWAAERPPVLTSPLRENHRTAPALVAAHQRLLDASSRLLSYAPLAPATSPTADGVLRKPSKVDWPDYSSLVGRSLVK